MSLDFINKSETVVEVVKDGVKVWSNPNISVSIDSLGRVFDEDGELLTKNKSNTYSVRINTGNKNIGWTASYTSLFSRIVLGIKLSNRTLRLKDESKGWVEDNVDAVSIHGMGASGKVAETKIDINTLEKLGSEKINSDNVNTSKDTDNTSDIYYKVIDAKKEYVTEDGGVFPTKELAEWHQEKVSKGKGNAQVVLDYNGGWVLAEQIYLQEVVYRCPKPYKNFKDVMDNVSGVLNKSQKERCVFSNIDVGILWTHGLSHLECLECSKVEAETINSKLADFISKYKMYTDSWNELRKAVEGV